MSVHREKKADQFEGAAVEEEAVLVVAAVPGVGAGIQGEAVLLYLGL